MDQSSKPPRLPPPLPPRLLPRNPEYIRRSRKDISSCDLGTTSSTDEAAGSSEVDERRSFNSRLNVPRSLFRTKHARVYATSLSDVFSGPIHTQSGDRTSDICVHCKSLGIWIYTITQQSRDWKSTATQPSDEPQFYDTKLVNTIAAKVLGGCGNCHFMLDCLLQAPFASEHSQIKRPESLLSYTQHYQITLHYNHYQSDCVLKLESVYTKNDPIDEEVNKRNLETVYTKNDPIGEEINKSKPESLSTRIQALSKNNKENYMRGPFGEKRHKQQSLFLLASCPIVFSDGQGKHIDKDPRSAVSLVSKWLEECQGHKNCPSQIDAPLPTRVIKISNIPGTNPSLWNTSGTLGKYMALSHCWGGSVPVTTTLDNIKAHENEITLAGLPKSFRDAIDVAQMLGFTYLWIDSICIIQNSVEDWASECSNMASVYANATLVLGAAAAEDSTQGFLNLRNFLQGPQLDSTHKLSLREKITSRKAQTTSPLSSRAWAYQESLLAPRLLLYTENQMSWECRHGIKDEGVNVLVSSNTSCSKKQFYRTIDLPLSLPCTLTENENRLAKYSSVFVKNVCSRLNTWYGCVEDYSHRQLTHASDKLPALSGLASAIRDPVMGEYLAGIWSGDLGTGLFWACHTARQELYDRRFSKCQKYRAPSWSWASYDGPANFRVETDTSSRQAIASDAAFSYNASGPSYSPKLLDYKMLLATSDNYGQVMEGSYITLEGFWRNMYPFNRAPIETTRTPAYGQDILPPQYRGLKTNDGSFTIRRDHPQGVQEKYTWFGTKTTPGSQLLLRFSSNRCLILKYVGSDSWERDGCCILPHDTGYSYLPVDSYIGWERATFKLI